MRSIRSSILEWTASGRIKPENIDAALAISGIFPNAVAWRRFIGDLLLWLGAILIAAGVIFFLAYNWQEIGKFAKFGLVETLIVAAVAGTWFYGLDNTAGKAALLIAALTTGGLMALFGQTYQTGADPWELFAYWALLILPWVLVAGLAALWLVWLALINLAVALYYQIFHGLFGILLGPSLLVWVLFALNTAALAIGEWFALRGISWLQSRWALRTVATVSGGYASALALWWIFEARGISHAALPIYLLWMGAAYWFYRLRISDLYVLAAGVLSAIIVITGLLSRFLLEHGGAGGFLLIGLIVIGLSAAGALWLKGVAAEDKQ